MHPGAVLTSLLSLAAAAGVWCWSRYEMRGFDASLIHKAALLQERQQQLEQENTALKQKLAEALEAAKPPPTPDEVATRILTTRELVFRRVPRWTPSTAEEIIKRLSTSAVAGLTPEVADARMRAAVAMGFVASPFDYREAMASLAAMKPGGFFEPETGKFYYQSDASMARADTREVFAGALLPVLLAQNFAGAAPPVEPDNDDAALASQALAFGDASFTRVRFSIADQGHANFDRGQAPATSPPAPNAPLFLAEMWKWSEDAGNLFVQTLHGKGGLASVNTAYRRPPQSSAEIMHAEKLYLADPPFAPVKVAFPDPAVNGTAPLLSNVAGEIGAYFLIRTFADMDYATAATEGWAGDRYLVWPGSKDHGDHVLWRSVWTTEEDAKQFFDALRRGAMHRHLIPWQKEYDVSPDQFRVDDPHRIIRLQRTGKTVTLLNATDPAFAKAAEEKFPP